MKELTPFNIVCTFAGVFLMLVGWAMSIAALAAIGLIFLTGATVK